METKWEQLGAIDNCFTNGQRKAAVELMDEYGMYDFFEDYGRFMFDTYCLDSQKSRILDAANSYFKIKNR